MAYEIAPTPTPTPAADFPVPTVRVLNFTGTGFTCSRGTGEQSNVITIVVTPPATTASPWNSANEAPTDSWEFLEYDFLAELRIRNS